MITLSPGCTSFAVAPFKQITPESRFLGTTYVSSIAPLFTSTHRSLGVSLSKQIISKLREYHIDAILEGKNGVYYDMKICSKEALRIKARDTKVGFYKGQAFYDSDKLVIWTNESSDF